MLRCSGQFIIAMFVFVDALTFKLSCLASIFFYIGKPSSQDNCAEATELATGREAVLLVLSVRLM